MPGWHTPCPGARRRPPVRILTYVRDEGPLSRMELAARLNVSRTTVAAEAGRLVELGLAEDGGPAASRGGRRSTLVDLDAGLRFVGIELGATSMRVAVTDGRLTCSPAASRRTRHPPRARGGARRGHRPHPQAARRAGRRAARRRRHRRPRPRRLPGRRAGRAADHAGLGRLPRPRRALAGARLPGPARQRRQRDGAGRAAHRRRPVGPTSSSSRSAPASAAASSSAGTSTAAPTAAPATSATSGSSTTDRSAPAATTAASRRSSAAPRWPATRPRRAGGPLRRARRAAGAGRRAHRRDVAVAAAAGDAAALQLVRDGGRRVGAVLADLVSFFNPGLIVIGGGVAGLGHPLLAEVRSVGLPPVAAAGHRQPARRAQRARGRRRRHRRRPADQRRGLRRRVTRRSSLSVATFATNLRFSSCLLSLSRLGSASSDVTHVTPSRSDEEPA